MSQLLRPLAILAAILAAGNGAPAQPMPGAVTKVTRGEALEKVFVIPDRIEETSGLVFHDSAFWTFNDSGGEPEIYRLDPESGSLRQTVRLEGAVNRDWEDMCQDEAFFYIGDFGNNRGDRRDLRIFKVAKAAIGGRHITEAPAEIISLRYTDQSDFTVRDRSHNYDCEAMVSCGDALLLFSKDWQDGHTRMYRISKEPGSYVVPPVSEFDAQGLVTGADLCEETGTLALLGYTARFPFVLLVRDFTGEPWSFQQVTRFDLTGMGGIQTEGICFYGKDALMISAERTNKSVQALYMLEAGDPGRAPETPRR